MSKQTTIRLLIILPIIIISRFLINPVDHYGFGGPYSKKVFRLYV